MDSILKKEIEHDRMRQLLFRKNIQLLGTEMSTEEYLNTCPDSELLRLMHDYYGKNHYELWQIKGENHG